METVKTFVEIIDYKAEFQPWFEKFNRDWIEKYFWMEPVDTLVLQHPEDHIIKKGGHILMAKVDREVAGTVALKFAAPGVYEFTKMAVDEKFRGMKVGEMLAKAAIAKARVLNANKIVLYSSTKLKPALALYTKLGFTEIPVDGPYKRSDIKLELPLKAISSQAIAIRRASINDAALLKNIGAQTFQETFAEHNTEDDMRMYVEKNFTVEHLLAELNDDRSEFYIAEHFTTAVGYIKLRAGHEPGQLKDHAIEIERLYSLKNYIGKGVGKILIETAFQKAKEKGFKTIWLGVWEHNKRALDFYRKYGFEKFGSHVFVLGKDEQTDFLMKAKVK
jgi:ribosomal protein S18 acetylase RimI-like enzyme